MYKIIKRSFLVMSFATLLVTNALTLINDAANATLSSLLKSLATPIVSMLSNVDEISTIRDRNNKEIKRLNDDLAKSKSQPKLTDKQKGTAKKVAERIKTRNIQRAAAGAGSIVAEALPFIGIAAIVAETGYEIYGYCETFNDMNELYSSLGLDPAVESNAITDVCNPTLPDISSVQSDVISRWRSWGAAVFEQLVKIKEFWGDAWNRWGNYLLNEVLD